MSIIETLQDPALALHEPVAQREQLAERYRHVRAFSEKLCEPLVTEDYVIQSMPDVSPAKWHLAHTTWFFDTFVLARGLPGYQVEQHYAFLFNSYYNAVGPMHCRPRRGLISRPTVEETYQYRSQVDGRMMHLLASISEEEWSALAPLVELGLHHEQQHQELLLMDIKHVFAQNPLYPVYRERRSPGDSQVNPLRWLSFPAGLFSIGADGEDFCFDNETPRHRVYVEPFQVGSRLVTNGEYLAFLADDGYKRPELWLSLGWYAVNEQKWEAPLYWERAGDRWMHFTLAGLRPLDLAEPVCHVSYFEADAFARWAKARLPTEAEWEIASLRAPLNGNFVDDARYHPAPAPNGQHGAAMQMFGDAWEWTSSAYSPYPGYQASAGALGEYNGKFMCNQYVLRGGCCATSASHIRRTYRNFFPPDKRWAFSGIRLARNAA